MALQWTGGRDGRRGSFVVRYGMSVSELTSAIRCNGMRKMYLGGNLPARYVSAYILTLCNYVILFLRVGS